MDGVEDSETLRQCSLASSVLRAYAQCALFKEVSIYLASDGSTNLDELLECYTTRSFAQHARCLSIRIYRAAPGTSDFLRRRPDLLKVITLLSTCQQDIDPGTTRVLTPPSQISSLYIGGMQESALDFARILRAFPRMTRLTLESGTGILGNSAQDELNLFLASAPPPPRIQDLLFCAAALPGLDKLIFPQEVDVYLRSVRIDCCRGMPAWGTLIRRAGAYLETIYVEQPVVYAGNGEFAPTFLCTLTLVAI